MDKRYQAFVSSTYSDLEEERQRVMRVLLEMDCIPSGMELFPAADDEQWSFIKRVIDDCDYYILILAGRYGSVGKDGVGYTEKEYRYAIERGKPVIAFVHRNIDKLTGDRLEKTDQGRKQLAEFRSLVTENRLCKLWNDGAELAGLVSMAMNQLIRMRPAVGWVRADQIDEAGAREALRLRKRVDELEAQNRELTLRPPLAAEGLSQGNDKTTFHAHFGLVQKRKGKSAGALEDTLADITDPRPRKDVSTGIELTWNELFATVAPLMIDELGETSMRLRIDGYIRAEAARKVGNEHPDHEITSGATDGSDFPKILVQLRALGLIAKSPKKHPPSNRVTYWTLTPYGDSVMTGLIAVKRTS